MPSEQDDESRWEPVDAASIGAAEAFAARWLGCQQSWGRDLIQVEYASGANHVWLFAVSIPDDSVEVGEEAIADAITGSGSGVQLLLPDLVALHRVIGGIIASLPGVHRQGKGNALPALEAGCADG